jgi:hypothetical protein
MASVVIERNQRPRDLCLPRQATAVSAGLNTTTDSLPERCPRWLSCLTVRGANNNFRRPPAVRARPAAVRPVGQRSASRAARRLWRRPLLRPQQFSTHREHQERTGRKWRHPLPRRERFRPGLATCRDGTRRANRPRERCSNEAGRSLGLPRPGPFGPGSSSALAPS